jgi:hypothetical protein
VAISTAMSSIYPTKMLDRAVDRAVFFVGGQRSVNTQTASGYVNGYAKPFPRGKCLTWPLAGELAVWLFAVCFSLKKRPCQRRCQTFAPRQMLGIAVGMATCRLAIYYSSSNGKVAMSAAMSIMSPGVNVWHISIGRCEIIRRRLSMQC